MICVMISVQLAVRMGIEEYVASIPEKESSLELIGCAIRLVDHGIDIVWDFFIGASLIFLSAALKGHSRFSFLWWMLPGLLGITLIVLNAITFPWPQDTQGLIDVGPAIGAYIIAPGARMLWISVRKNLNRNEERTH